MEPIRVLHIVGKMHRGGIESLLMCIYRHIDRTKVQFDFLVTTKDHADYDDEIRAMGGRLLYVRSRRENPISNYYGIYKILKNHPEIVAVHNHLSSCTYIEPLIIAKFVGVPIRIAHSHNTQFGGGRIKRIIHSVNRKILDFVATDFFACSKAAGKWMFTPNAWKNGLVVNNGIESVKYSYNEKTRKKYRDELNLDDKFVVGYVGRFEEQKNPLFICKIFAALRKENQQVKLLMVGEGSLHEKMDCYLKEMDVFDDVIYTGVVNNVTDYLQAMDCFVLPSLFEGLGIVAIEAQAAGLPTLLSDKVPEDAIVTNLATSLSIEQGEMVWVNEIMKVIMSSHVRENVMTDIISAGYDILQTAKILEDFYTTKKDDKQ